MSFRVTLPDGAQLHYEDAGEGEALILIPGWAYSAEIFSRLTEQLAGDYRVIAIDPRSHGKSSTCARGHNYVQHGADLKHILNHLALDNFTLVGWSLGVYDALCYLDAFGISGMNKLVLLDESPVIVKELENDWGEGFREEIDGLIATVEGEYLAFFRDYMAAGFDEPAPKAVLDRFTAFAASLSPAQASYLLRDATQYDFRDLLANLDGRVPVMQVLREDWSENGLNWLRENTPNAHTLVLGGHLMIWEYPATLAAAIKKFLA